MRQTPGQNREKQNPEINPNAPESKETGGEPKPTSRYKKTETSNSKSGKKQTNTHTDIRTAIKVMKEKKENRDKHMQKKREFRTEGRTNPRKKTENRSQQNTEDKRTYTQTDRPTPYAKHNDTNSSNCSRQEGTYTKTT